MEVSSTRKALHAQVLACTLPIHAEHNFPASKTSKLAAAVFFYIPYNYSSCLSLTALRSNEPPAATSRIPRWLHTGVHHPPHARLSSAEPQSRRQRPQRGRRRRTHAPPAPTHSSRTSPRTRKRTRGRRKPPHARALSPARSLCIRSLDDLKYHFRRARGPRHNGLNTPHIRTSSPQLEQCLSHQHERTYSLRYPAHVCHSLDSTPSILCVLADGD